MKWTKIISSFLLLVCISIVQAQSPNPTIRKGNSKIEDQNFADAEVEYKKALDLRSSEKIAVFNLGNAVYEQGRYEESRTQHEQAVEMYENKEDKGAAYHNIGNSYLAEKEYEKSIAAYKNALKQFPNDMDTKYNLAYAQKMLEKEQQQQEQNQDQQQDDQENQENEDENEQDQNQDEGDENEDDKDGDKEESEQDGDEEQDDKGDEKEDEKDGNGDEEEEKNDEGQGNQNPQQAELTKEEAEQLLRALSNEEQKLQEEMKEENMTPVNISIEKDW